MKMDMSKLTKEGTKNKSHYHSLEIKFESFDISEKIH